VDPRRRRRGGRRRRRRGGRRRGRGTGSPERLHVPLTHLLPNPHPPNHSPPLEPPAPPLPRPLPPRRHAPPPQDLAAGVRPPLPWLEYLSDSVFRSCFCFNSLFKLLAKSHKGERGEERETMGVGAVGVQTGSLLKPAMWVLLGLRSSETYNIY
jgi:hypothetical protein